MNQKTYLRLGVLSSCIVTAMLLSYLLIAAMDPGTMGALLITLFFSFAAGYAYPHVSKNVEEKLCDISDAPELFDSRLLDINKMLEKASSVQDIGQIVSSSLCHSLELSSLFLCVRFDHSQSDDFLNYYDDYLFSSREDIPKIQRHLPEIFEKLLSSTQSTQVLELSDEMYGYSKLFPLRNERELIGFVMVSEKTGRKVVSEFKLNTALATVSTHLIRVKVLEGIKEGYQTQVKKAIKADRVEIQLKKAGSAQMRLLPQEKPDRGIFMDHIFMPSKELSGDYWHWRYLGSDKILILLGDIMGKGIIASIGMTTLALGVKGYFDLLGPQNNFELEGLFYYIQEKVVEADHFDGSLSLFGGLIDLKKKTFSYLSCGISGVSMISKGEAIELPMHNESLGIDPGPFKLESRPYIPGDRLLVFSDGVFDIANEESERLGISRFDLIKEEALKKERSLVLPHIKHELLHFRSTADLADDTTAIFVEILE